MAKLHVRETADVMAARNLAREFAARARLGDVDMTKLVTVASELARNMVLYAGGGEVDVDLVEEAGRHGVRMRFEDKGPGIADLGLAMNDGYSTNKGLGLGLPGARRLADRFEIVSQPGGGGTRIEVIKWKR